MVLCVDAQLPGGAVPETRGRAGTHDYKRHGATLNAPRGSHRLPAARHQEFLGFLRLIERHVPAELDVHLIIDNYAAHKHDNVTKWLQAPRRKPLAHPLHAHLRVVAESAGSKNSPRLRRDCVNQLIGAIGTAHCETAEEIVRRGRAALNHPTKSATDH